MAPKSTRRGKLRLVKKKKKVRREGSAHRRSPLPQGVRMLLVAIAVVAAMGFALWGYFAVTSARAPGPPPPLDPPARPFPNDRIWHEPG